MLVSILVALFAGLFAGALFIQEGEKAPDSLFGAAAGAGATVGFANVVATQAAGFSAGVGQAVPAIGFAALAVFALTGPLAVLVACRRQREATLRADHERQGRFYAHCVRVNRERQDRKIAKRAREWGFPASPAPVGWEFVETSV